MHSFAYMYTILIYNALFYLSTGNIPGSIKPADIRLSAGLHESNFRH